MAVACTPETITVREARVYREAAEKQIKEAIETLLEATGMQFESLEVRTTYGGLGAPRKILSVELKVDLP